MDETSATITIIIMAVALFIVILFLGPLIQAAGPPPYPRVVTLGPVRAEQVVFGPVRPNTDGTWEWSSIDVTVNAKFSAELDRDIEVVPIFIVQGTEAKAAASFSLKKDEPEFSGVLKTSNVITSNPPAAWGRLEQGNPFTEGQKLFFELRRSDGIADHGSNLAVTLIDLHPQLSDGLQCSGTFAVECSSRLYSFDLLPIESCSSGFLEPCQKVIELCNSTVTVTGERMSCGGSGGKSACVTVSADPGRDPLSFPVGERVGLAFFKKSACVDQMESIRERRLACSDDYLGGPYYFTGPLTGQAIGTC